MTGGITAARRIITVGDVSATSVNITIWSYVEATDALSRALTELRSAAGIPPQPSGSQNGIEHGVKQAQPIVGGPG